MEYTLDEDEYVIDRVYIYTLIMLYRMRLLFGENSSHLEEKRISASRPRQAA